MAIPGGSKQRSQSPFTLKRFSWFTASAILFPVESRAFGKGILDNAFMQGGLEVWDQAGGGMAMQEHFVSVRKLSEGGGD